LVTSKAHIRIFTEDDLPGVLSLYDSTLSKSPHFARDGSFVRYFTHYTGVSADGVFVALENDRIVGFAIASITSEGDLRQGSIVELRAMDTACLESLIQAACDYCAGKGVDMMVVVPPPGLDTGKVFSSWLEFGRTVMMCRPLSILPVLEALLDTERVKRCYAGKELLFMVDGETIQVRISGDSVEAIEISGASDKVDTLIVVSSRTLIAIACGMASPCLAYLARRVRVRRFRDVAMVLRLLRDLRLDKPWYVALGDSM
jgi:hypothetical protein